MCLNKQLRRLKNGVNFEQEMIKTQFILMLAISVHHKIIQYLFTLNNIRIDVISVEYLVQIMAHSFVDQN